MHSQVFKPDLVPWLKQMIVIQNRKKGGPTQ